MVLTSGTKLWAARVVTALAAVGAFEGFAAAGHRLEAAPILAIYAVVLGLLLRRSPPIVAYGMQLGLGTALTVLSVGMFLLIAFAAALVVTDFPSMLGRLLLAGLLNVLMIPSAIVGRWGLAKDGKTIVRFWLGFLLVLIPASGYLFLSWWRPLAR